jgi:NifU-like protein
MQNSEEERVTIEDAIAAVRPAIQSDGGDLELVSIERDIVRVHLGGNCAGCHMAGQTLGGIRRHLTEALGRPVRVLPAWKD